MDPRIKERMKSQLRRTGRIEIPNSYDCTITEVVQIGQECGLTTNQMLISASDDGETLIVTDMGHPVE